MTGCLIIDMNFILKIAQELIFIVHKTLEIIINYTQGPEPQFTLTVQQFAKIYIMNAFSVSSSLKINLKFFLQIVQLLM